MKQDIPVYQQHLGARFETLPEQVHDFHALQGKHRLSGHVTIQGAETSIGKVLGVFMGFPSAAPNQPFSFELDATPQREVWTRFFPTRKMRSCLSARGEFLTEAFGPIRLFFQLDADADKLDMHLKRMTFLGIPLPKCLVPGVQASEHGADGLFNFHIVASWPANRRVVAYTGTLQVPKGEVRS
jgi:hypothetical protein